MNFLAWMFGLGAMAIAFPLLFHLIRRTPRGKQTFSSLMFLREAPPRITRKSRLENWLLLLLRSLAVILLAIAFMRPFFPQSTQVTSSLGKRVAILVDTSASMRRGDLWQKSIAKIDDLMSGLDADDDISLIAFDRDVRTAVGFDSANLDSLNNKKTLIRQELQRIGPTWSKTDLGKALVFAADQLDAAESQASSSDDSNADDTSNDIQIGGQIFVVTDSQEGADTNALANYNWPKNVMVQIHPIESKGLGNVFPKLMVDEAGLIDDHGPRVRLTNSSDATQSEFTVRWANDESDSSQTHSDAVKFFVSPGSSQSLPVPRAVSSTNRLVVTGDNATFDDQFFVAPMIQQSVAVGYIGKDDAEDVEGLQYYLRRAYAETPRRKIDVIDDKDELKTMIGNPVASPDLMVVSKPVDVPELAMLTEHLKLGRTILFVLTSAEMADSLAPLLGVLNVENISGDREKDFRMLGQIDFKHPLFQPLSGPQFNDFTKIRFWQHRAVLNLDTESTIIAKFDNGDAALWNSSYKNESINDGEMLVMTSGWNPEESQLFRQQSKFVPLMLGVLEQAVGEQTLGTTWVVDDAIELPSAKTAMTRKVINPDGKELTLNSDEQFYLQADQPGIYQLQQDGQQILFAVNLDENESRTLPADPEGLSVYQVRLGSKPTDEELVERLQQANNLQIESRQKIWKWAIIAILVVLIGETILAGRRQNIKQLQAEAAG